MDIDNPVYHAGHCEGPMYRLKPSIGWTEYRYIAKHSKEPDREHIRTIYCPSQFAFLACLSAWNRLARLTDKTEYWTYYPVDIVL